MGDKEGVGDLLLRTMEPMGNIGLGGGEFTFTGEAATCTMAKAEWGETVEFGGGGGLAAITIRRPLNDIARQDLGALGMVALALHDRLVALEGAR